MPESHINLKIFVESPYIRFSFLLDSGRCWLGRLGGIMKEWNDEQWTYGRRLRMDHIPETHFDIWNFFVIPSSSFQFSYQLRAPIAAI